ncbi:hypothetical protein Desaci_1389 [Desulfosporosinus acidiphilus SJ4]|uniref:SurA-like protein n=1 Tax=Desulfosporosinus acidiphilus (strain DSM 22704 / JCM 16185 / SJ4) TaxID=646529 RepID=I4D3N8_DESAJ|nr:SurA N-terminal domain-containing protein [Desulfosporosinus acidiphilus]AFM40412.1 hypothetical protein Desaci_1389 [Desulfosporosinus acidiphilus SJ4]
MHKKHIKILTIAFALTMLLGMTTVVSAETNPSNSGSTSITLTPSGRAVTNTDSTILPPKVTNTKYPNVVAKIYSEEISGAQLTSRIALIKRDYERSNKPKADTQYEQIALQQLVRRALINHEVQVRGITTSEEDAATAATKSVQYLMNLDNNNIYKKQFLEMIKEMGYSSPNQYETDPIIIGFYQEHLNSAKLEKQVVKEILPPTDNEVDSYLAAHGIKNNSSISDEIKQKVKISLYQQRQSAYWTNFTQKLIDGNNYNLFVNVNIHSIN